MIRTVVSGPSLCGKSTLVQDLSRGYFAGKGIRSLVLDPVARSQTWGAHSWVSYNEDEFWKAVWQCRNCLVIVDDGSVTIKRDKDLIPVFTTMRHLHHRLIVVAHDASDFTPTMRRQFDTMYLFRQSPDSAEAWYNVFLDKDIFQCAQLNQYEFIKCRNFQKTERLRLTI